MPIKSADGKRDLTYINFEKDWSWSFQYSIKLKKARLPDVWEGKFRLHAPVCYRSKYKKVLCAKGVRMIISLLKRAYPQRKELFLWDRMPDPAGHFAERGYTAFRLDVKVLPEDPQLKITHDGLARDPLPGWIAAEPVWADWCERT